MSYLRLLDEAHHQLERGELLAAEDLLRRAREAWARSRFRAPVVERGLEPVLRRAGKWLGRQSNSPVLPVFGHRAARLEEDLASLARLLRDEALDLARQRGESHGQRELELLERALRLDRESTVFVLDGPERWAIAKSYLQVGRRLARAPRSDLLPRDVAVVGDLVWLGEWAEAWLAGGALGDPATLDWVVRQASAAATLSQESAHDASRWWWIAARAAARDPLDGPRALMATQRALEGSGLADEARDRALRALAGLLVNERILAGPGADPAAVLRRHAPLAGSREWPDPEIVELLNARARSTDAATLVTLAWSVDGEELVLVSHRGARASDALAVRIVESPRDPDSFAATVAEARGWIHRWLPGSCVLVLPGAPPPKVLAVLGDAPRLRVDLLRSLLGREEADVEPAAPWLAHPLWSAGPAPEPWSALASAARAAVPVLTGILSDSPSFASSWGRANLRALSDYGLALCGALDLAAQGLAGPPGPAPVELQTVMVRVELRWPRLQERPWPRAAESAGRSEVIDVEVDVPPALEPGTDAWVGRRATAAELAAIAVAHRRTEVLTVGGPRAAAIAAQATARIDPREVTVAPARERCAEPWLALLEDWIGEAVADPLRQLDVVWLLRTLSETATGDPLAQVPPLPPSSLASVKAVAERDLRCGPQCRLARDGGCWTAQLAGRRERARVWIVDLEQSADTLEGLACVLLDDPRTFVAQAASLPAEARLEHALGRVQAAERAWMWMNAGVLTDAILEAWRKRLPRPRPLHRRPGSGLRSNAELWTAPAGYRPGDPFLGLEAERLLELRAEVLESARQDAVWWTLGSAGGVGKATPTVEGVAAQPQVPEVICASLGGAAPHSALLLLLRAGAALSYASARVIVLDPRLAHLLGHTGGAWNEGASTSVADESLREALGPGARLLSGRRAQPGGQWLHPIDRARMSMVQQRAGTGRRVDDAELEALARALRESARGHALMLASASDGARRLVIDTVRALAEASEDGGPFGVRCVVVVGAPGTWHPTDARARSLSVADDRSLGTVVLEVERGSVTRIDLAADLLEDDGVHAWAGRASSVAWFFVRGDRDLDADPLWNPGDPEASRQGAARAQRWREAVGRANSRAIAFVDAVAPGAERVAHALDARVIPLESAPSIDDWIVRTRAVPAVEIACPHCEATMVVADLYACCPACGRRAWMRSLGRARAWSAVEEALAQRLRREADQRTWWAVGARADRVRHLRERLGLQPWGHDEAPLLTASRRDERDIVTAVWSAGELWEQRGPVPDVFLIGMVRGAEHLRAILARLDAIGTSVRVVESLLGPVGLESADTMPPVGGKWRWTAARTEVEFRLRTRLRARAFGSDGPRAGLGPTSAVPRFEDDACEVLDALLGGSRPNESIEAAVANALGELERAGLTFGASTARPLPEHLARAHGGVLRWAISEGLLEHDRELHDDFDRIGDDRRASDAMRSRAWERALRGSDAAHGERVGRLPTYSAVSPGHDTFAERFVSARRLGIAGSGKTTWLRDRVESARAMGQRVLVIVPAAGSRAAWSRVGLHAVEVVTPEEIALAFLRDLRIESGDRMPRLLPPAGRSDGEEIRLRLMRETSRHYAQAAGSVPAIEAADLRRAVEDDPFELLATAGEELDVALLARCAEQARAAAGWLTTRQLRERCRRWSQRERDAEQDWSTRYPIIALDDAQDVHPELLAFLRELFQGSHWWETADPLVGPVPPPRELTRDLEADLQSRSMPREWISAIEVLWRGAPALPGRPRTTRKGRDARRLQCVRVLTLEAAHDWIVAEIATDRVPDRTAVVIAHEQDRAWLAQSLRTSRHEVRVAERLARWSARGPRELLAALHLLLDTTEQVWVRERLLAAVFGPAFEASESGAVDLLRDFDAARRNDLDPPPIVDVESARLAVLVSLEAQVRAADTLGDALAPLLRCGVLDPLLAGDAAVGRLREVLEQESAFSVPDLLDTVPAEFIAYPVGSSTALWVLGPDDLSGGNFDHVIHVCTGYESPARHYRVLAAATERFTLLHSERDPLR